MSLQGGLGIERMCMLAGASRAGFYRYLRQQDPWDEEMEVRSERTRRITPSSSRPCQELGIVSWFR